ncbi:hypothetical protein JYU23_00635 [bacterium AH-315-C07]|nr:hypothetical protein [bacterium AH-315-C07]
MQPCHQHDEEREKLRLRKVESNVPYASNSFSYHFGDANINPTKGWILAKAGKGYQKLNI